MRRLGGANRGADRGAQAGGGAGGDGAVEKLAGLARHAEVTRGERGGDILRSRAVGGELEIVDDAGAVHGDGGEDAAAHEVDDQRAQSDLDGMSPHAEHDGAAAPVALGDRRGDTTQIARAEEVGKGVEEVADAHGRCRHLAERRRGDFGLSLRQRVGANLGEIERARSRPAGHQTDLARLAAAPRAARSCSTSSQSVCPIRMCVS